MRVLATGALLVLCSFLLHLLLWRLRTPRRQTRALLLIFVALPAAALLLAGLAAAARPAAFPVAGLLFPPGLVAGAHTALFCLSLALAYITTVGEIEVDSPSLALALAIGRAGARGIGRGELDAIFTDAVLVDPRLRDLVRDGMAVHEGGRYRVTAKGRRIARLFDFYRRLLRLTDRGG